MSGDMPKTINVFIANYSPAIKKVANQLRKNRYKNIRMGIEKNQANEAPFKLWHDKHYIEDGVNIGPNGLFHWNIRTEKVDRLANYGLMCVDWHCRNYHEDFVILDDASYPKNMLIYFEDSTTDLLLPATFNRIHAFADYDHLIGFLRNQQIIVFSLQDKNSFERANNVDVVKGASAFKEIATGRYWYLDTFHKNHYEVFDSTGIHLGEADLNGNLDTNKADPKKRIQV